jgi:hypothetical protein
MSQISPRRAGHPFAPALALVAVLTLYIGITACAAQTAQTAAPAPTAGQPASQAPAETAPAEKAPAEKPAQTPAAEPKSGEVVVDPDEPVAAVSVPPAPVNQDVVPFEGPIPLAPPDGKWLRDEHGRPYFVHRIAKIGGAYHWEVPDKRVLLPRGLMFDVVGHGDNYFDVKIYGADPDSVAAQQQKRAEITPEEKARVAATYKTDLAASDRLRFLPLSQGLPQQGQWRQGFDVADINGDGKLDIVHGPQRKGGTRPAIFLGDGKGTWRSWSAATYPAIPFDYGDAAVADFNGDKKPDLAIASHLRGITVLVGDGKGRFQPWTQGIEFAPNEQQTPIFSSRAIEPVDWNGDGRMDLLAWGEGPRLATTRSQTGDFGRGPRGAVVYLNQGDGTWQKKGEEKGVSYGDSLVVADFNRDGRPDFAAASAVTGYRALIHLAQEDGSWKAEPIAELRPQGTVRSLAAGDFDRDGQLDLAVGFANRELGIQRTGVDVLLARPGGTWERRSLHAEDIQFGIWALDAGDLDGDKNLDLVAITGRGAGWVFLGDGKGGFTREGAPEMDVSKEDCTGYHVKLVDVDGDGGDEVVAGYAGEGSALFNTVGRCPTGGSLRVWKAEKQGR